jgi:large subunit ribosomal protein L19
MSTIIEAIEKKQMKQDVPELMVGDTVCVSKIIVEGKKQRVQKYEGVITEIQGIRSRLSFTVRKIVDSIGVEKTYLLHSELVPEVKIIKRAKVRRARLRFLRDRVGTKATRLKTRD